MGLVYDTRLFSQTATEAWNTGESVNCDRPRTQTTSRSICSFAVIGWERCMPGSAGVTGDMVPSADPVLGTKPAGGSRSHWRI